MSDSYGFGDYVRIEQKRYGVENEMYLHKVIRSLRSNSYVTVPVDGSRNNGNEQLHGESVDVVQCICCGIDETVVKKYRTCDVEPSSISFDEIVAVRMHNKGQTK